MLYRFDNPTIPTNEQTAVWIRVPLTKIRTPDPSKRNIPIQGKIGYGEELFEKYGEYGPDGDSLTIDGETVKANITLTILNRSYDPQRDPNANRREKSKLAEAKALVDSAKAAEVASSCKKVTLETDLVLRDGTILPAGMTVPSHMLATVLTGQY